MHKPESRISHTQSRDFFLQPSLFIRSSISNDDKIRRSIVDFQYRGHNRSQTEAFCQDDQGITFIQRFILGGNNGSNDGFGKG